MNSWFGCNICDSIINMVFFGRKVCIGNILIAHYINEAALEKKTHYENTPIQIY